MAAVLVSLSVLRASYPNMCGAVLHIPVLAESFKIVSESDDLSSGRMIVDASVTRYCIADSGHEGDHVLWIPAGVWLSAYETLPPGWRHEPEVAEHIAFWVRSGRPYPGLDGERWV